jgi:2-polyprenyl-6-methoxyphenol hydroxylase-like FAD-dependent oxidoreductase
MPAQPSPEKLKTRCCIVGGGPAGMMLGYLLARGGVEVLVLEKHADFLRDFRGDTIHPSTMEVMSELGLLDEFLQRPHQKVRELVGYVENRPVHMADFTHLKVHCPFIALMPQWDFLNFLVGEGKHHAAFHVRMEAEMDELIFENQRVVGVRAKTPTGTLEVRAEVVIGADGRRSQVRARSGLPVREVGAPMDVLWFRLPRVASDPAQVLGRFTQGRIIVMLDRGDYWQCGFVIAKGDNDVVRQRGLEAFRRDIAATVPFIGDRVNTLQDWDAIKLLTVAVDRLKCWHRPGLLCIGDSAHAMSPVGGVGINLAIQDAVATANILVPAFRRGPIDEGPLRAVQRRRMFPTRATQWMQVIIQNRVIKSALQSRGPLPTPWILRQVERHPWLRRIPARVVGVGFRPEHVEFLSGKSAVTSSAPARTSS